MATLLFSASHDSGDFSDYDSTVDADGDMTVVAAAKSHGSHGIRFLTDDANEMTARKTLSATSKYYLSWWMKLPSVTVSLQASWRLVTFTWQGYAYVRFETDGTMKVRFDNHAGVHDYHATSSNFLDDTWHHWEGYWDKDAAGWLKVDGNQEATATGGGAGTVNSLRLGNSGQYGGVSYNVDIDSVELYDDVETSLLWPALPSVELVGGARVKARKRSWKRSRSYA